MTKKDYQLIKDTAVRAIKKAGAILIEKHNRKVIAEYKENDAKNIVTEADYTSNNIICNEIKKAFRYHDILSEELKNNYSHNSEFLWIIDPLDGTNNFIKGNPYYCVSIAVQYNDETILGIVYQPKRNKLIIAEKGKGSVLVNGNDNVPNRITICGEKNLKDAVICTDWSHLENDLRKEILQTFESLVPRVRGILTYGSGALAATHVACGIFDAYFNLYSRPWDHAAADLIIREAGGFSTTTNGEPHKGKTDSILVANETLHTKILRIIQKIA